MLGEWCMDSGSIVLWTDDSLWLLLAAIGESVVATACVWQWPSVQW